MADKLGSGECPDRNIDIAYLATNYSRVQLS